MDTINSTRYYGIYSDFRKEQFVTKELAYKAGALFVLEEIYGTNKNGNYTNREYNYNFYNSSGEAIKYITFDGWTLKIVVASDNYFQQEQIYGIITDPSGRIQPTRRFGHTMSGVDCAFEVFKKMTEFESFQNYTLSERVSELEEELKALKARKAKSK